MDYIQEIATAYIRWRNSGENSSNPKIGDIDAEIETAVIKEFPGAGSTLWKWQDERTIELLTTVLYAHPDLIARIVQSKAVPCPPFLQDIVEKSHNYLAKKGWFLSWKSKLKKSKSVEDYKGSSKGNLDELLSPYFPSSRTTIDQVDSNEFRSKLQDALLGSPAFVFSMAKALDCAVPFTLVLHEEMDDILESRKLRLQPDDDAQAALILKELNKVDIMLERSMSTSTFGKPIRWSSPNAEGTVGVGEGDEWDKEAGRLLEQKKNLLKALADRLQLKESKGKAAGSNPSPETRSPGATSSTPEGSGENAATTCAGIPAPKDIEFPPRRAANTKLIGLAFSGGGIRSATFNLGVLQALADLDLLRKVDYLSVVSGGGYIAAWLSAWCLRQKDGIRRVQRWLSPWRSPDPTTAEVKPIWFLRQYSNYLTPKKGIFSADTWTLVTIWTRNTLLNQIILVSFLAGLLLLPRALAYFSRDLGASDIALASACLLLLTTAILIGLNLSRFERSPGGVLRESSLPRWFAGQAGVQITIVAVLIFVAYWASTLMSFQLESIASKTPLSAFLFSSTTAIVSAGIFGFLLVAQVFGRFHRCFYFHNFAETTLRRKVLALAVLLVVNLVTGLAGGMLIAVVTWAFAGISQDVRPIHILTWGPVLVIAVLFGILTLQIGLLGINFPDERREWWGRLAAWLCIYALGWLAIFAIAFYGPWLSFKASTALQAAGGVVWVTTTMWGLIKGRATKAPLAPGQQKSNLLSWGEKIAPYVFIVGLLVVISVGVHWALVFSGLTGVEGGQAFSPRLADLVPYYTDGSGLYAPLIAFALGLFFTLRVDINEFSMHHLYRNRLMRCYLGATRRAEERKANPFTGFDSTDDVQLSALKTGANNVPKSNPYLGPYLIVNTALNLVSGQELAWQERKAESFFFSPRYSGYEIVNPGPGSSDDKWAMAAYRPTQSYAYRGGGVGVATATSISGAATNPNMGYHSSPALTFLMTLFNIRLGWWIGNPRHEKKWKKSSPGIGLLYLLAELTGATEDTSAYINLSDGGHFENLGVYELVRRRCRYIIACDSEEDRNFTFGGLGNLVRKCRTDFGVEINLRLDQIRPIDAKNGSKAHCVVGEIRYPGPEPSTGVLLYIKSSLTRDEAVDVLEYCWRENRFPHQTTADQWFDESQFESYRVLGFHTSYTAFKNASLDGNLDDIFGELRDIWYPASPAVEKSFTKHAQAYQDLMERARQDRNLRFMDSILSPDFDEAVAMATGTVLPPQKELNHAEGRSVFYFCNSLIQLMENVYVDLNLEHEIDQPENHGWTQLFKFWFGSDVLKTVWHAVRKTYSSRFQVFCERRLIEE